VSIALRPCPFCGEASLGVSGKCEMNLTGVKFFVRCMSCGALGPDCSRELWAELAWNVRDEDDRVERP
jgi:hypothetical protein